MRIPIRIPLASALLLVGLSPAIAHAQGLQGFRAENQLVLSRADLTAEMTRLDAVGADLELPDYERESALRRGDYIRTRLSVGDFRQGDRVEIRVSSLPDLPPETPWSRGQACSFLG
jgi:hypothetical protein